ncbi:MAG TPA: NUDIX domain-containing protein [Thermomicrobiales bacterium]|nr:NUDIX domain-containing protein [Thermomicrobiales bacterium]
MILPVRRTVKAYITHRQRLLVFRQPDFPDAGIQAPGGAVRPDEPLDDAALREAFEETGLADLRLVAFLGDTRYDGTPRGKPEIDHRHYYHLRADGDVPERWQHWETDPSDGPHDRILFELFWVSLPHDVPPLIAGMDEMLPALVERLRREALLR